MGFTTGLLGGVTLTYSVLYLTLYIHQANRKYQHTLLSQQSVLLNSVIEPLPPLPEPPAYDVKKVSMIETLKDRWNGEVEGLVRKAQNTDWNHVRERWEARIGTVFAKVRESEAGDRLKEMKENVVGTDEEVKKAATEAIQPKRLLEIR